MNDGSLSRTALLRRPVQLQRRPRSPLSSVCTTLVAWARSRRVRQIGPHSVSFLLPFLFLWPFNSLFISFGGCSACSGRYCRPLARPELLSGLIAQLLSSVSCHSC